VRWKSWGPLLRSSSSSAAAAATLPWSVFT
jgi:hypothetical protein